MSFPPAVGVARLARFRSDGLAAFEATPSGLMNALAPWLAFALVGFVLVLVSGSADTALGDLLGTVVALLAEEGATLEKGAPILTLEVMKMEQTLRAPFAGVLKAIRCKVGDIVQEGVELAEVEPIGE